MLYCSGSMCVGVKVWFGWGGVVSLCRLKHMYMLMVHSVTLAGLDILPEDGPTGTETCREVLWNF